MAVQKMNQAYRSWGKPEIDVATFKEKIMRFNQHRMKVTALVRKYQKMYQEMHLTDQDLKDFVNTFNEYRLYWNQDSDFTESIARNLFEEATRYEAYSHAGEIFPSISREQLTELLEKSPHERRNRRSHVIPRPVRERSL